MIMRTNWVTAPASRSKRILLLENVIPKFELSLDARTLP